MFFVYSLRALARWFGDLRNLFEDMAGAISGIWLIGVNLSHWFYDIADSLGWLQSTAYDLADDFYSFYTWVEDNIKPDSITGALLYYADDLLNFIQNPWEWIGDAVRQWLPNLQDLQDDPAGFVIRVIRDNTGFDWYWLNDPYGVVWDTVNDALGSIREFTDDPTDFIRRQLAQVIPMFWTLIDDPRAWVGNFLPDIPTIPQGLIDDPIGFVVDLFFEGVEGRLETYRDRLVNLAVRIIERIF